MTEVLRLKGETIHGETREFPANFVVAIDGENGNWRVADGAKTCVIDPATIQPADDQRKAMLEEIRAELRGLIRVQAKGLPAGYPCEWVDRILGEMEAKL